MVMRKFTILSLCTAIGAIATFLFYLIFNYGQPVWFTEPNLFIRIPEIIIGLISIPFLFRLILIEIREVWEEVQYQ